ncbi:unnamed protein product [Orchesella dallaii]|uniref:Uncharacterized protein n=1 Tax=Orchesella dallaii TaxID=48710 RepID=A0ABP1S3L5_9HEXA
MKFSFFYIKGSEAALESLDFRLRYVEQVQLVFSKSIMELKNRMKIMEDALTDNNITITSNEIHKLI